MYECVCACVRLCVCAQAAALQAVRDAPHTAESKAEQQARHSDNPYPRRQSRAGCGYNRYPRIPAAIRVPQCVLSLTCDDGGVFSKPEALDWPLDELRVQALNCATRATASLLAPPLLSSRHSSVPGSHTARAQVPFTKANRTPAGTSPTELDSKASLAFSAAGGCEHRGAVHPRAAGRRHCQGEI